MIYLQSNKFYSKILELDPQSGKHDTVGRDALTAHGRLGRINGVFDLLNDTLVALYTLNGKLILRVGDRAIPLNERVTVSVSGAPSHRLLTVTQGGTDPVHIKYDIRDSLRGEDNPTPFIDDEDSDFGIFIVNIFTDPARRFLALEHWKQAQPA